MSDKDLSVNQRIKFIIENYSNLTQRAFSNKIGVSQSAISSLFSQRENRPGLEMLQKIAIAYPEISLEWLLIGQGEMLKPAVEPSDLRQIELIAKNLLDKGLSSQLYIDLEDGSDEARLAAFLKSEADLRHEIRRAKYLLENKQNPSLSPELNDYAKRIATEEAASLEVQYMLTVYSRMHIERTLSRQEASTIVYRVTGEPDPSKSYGGLLSTRLDISVESALHLVKQGYIRSAFIDGEGYRVTEQAVRAFFGEE